MNPAPSPEMKRSSASFRFKVDLIPLNSLLTHRDPDRYDISLAADILPKHFIGGSDRFKCPYSRLREHGECES